MYSQVLSEHFHSVHTYNICIFPPMDSRISSHSPLAASSHLPGKFLLFRHTFIRPNTTGTHGMDGERNEQEMSVEQVGSDGIGGGLECVPMLTGANQNTVMEKQDNAAVKEGIKRKNEEQQKKAYITTSE